MVGPRLRSPERDLKAANNSLSKAYRVARQAGLNAQEIESQVQVQWKVLRIAQEVMNAINSRRLVNEAAILGIPTPIVSHADDETWIQGEYTLQWHLTVQGFHKIRNAVRAERRDARAEQREKWAQHREWGMFITGLLGASTGLVAVLGLLLQSPPPP